VNSLLAFQEAVQFGPATDLRLPLSPRRRQGSQRQLPVEVFGDLCLGLSRLLPQEVVEALELGPHPGRVHPGWHRWHRLAAGQLETKPLEGALDPLKLAPD